MVATVRALKIHGGVTKADLASETWRRSRKGMANLERHVDNVQATTACPAWCRDQPLHDRHRRRIALLQRAWRAGSARKVVLAATGPSGGAGAECGWRAVVRICAARPRQVEASSTTTDARCGTRSQRSPPRSTAPVRHHRRRPCAQADRELQDERLRPLPGVHGQDPVCLLDRPQLRGAPSGHTLNIREVRLAAGASSS
jgi:formate--tetrahydrofolate ligase